MRPPARRELDKINECFAWRRGLRGGGLKNGLEGGAHHPRPRGLAGPQLDGDRALVYQHAEAVDHGQPRASASSSSRVLGGFGMTSQTIIDGVSVDIVECQSTGRVGYSPIDVALTTMSVPSGI